MVLGETEANRQRKAKEGRRERGRGEKKRMNKY